MWDKIRQGAAETYYFLSSRIFLINFAKLVAILAVTYFVLFRLLNCYTRHGESAKVGNYVGLSVQQATTKAEGEGFDISVSDSIFLIGQRPDMVTAQNPTPNSKVKQGRTIYLTITKAKADLIMLPSLVGGNDDYNFYAKKLDMMGITGRIIRKETNPQYEDGTIIDVQLDGKSIMDQLASGYKVSMGSTVDFVVTQKEGDEAIVPDLACKTADEASFLLQSSHFAIGIIDKDVTVTNQNTAYVVNQVPVAGTKLKKGEAVNISLTQTKPAQCPN